MINYFKQAERVLSERGTLERALGNLEQRRARIVKQGQPPELKAVDPSRPHVSTSGADDALTSCLDLVEINRQISGTQEIIAEIDAVLDQLDEADAKLLRAWYVEGATKKEIAVKLHLSPNSTRSLYELKNNAVSTFAILYFGAGALGST